MKYIIDIPNEMVIKSPLKGMTLGIAMMETSTQKQFIIPTNIPLISYIEPQKGKWIRGDSEKLQGKWRCSVCNKTTYHICADFCPNCGAYMREGGQDEND